MPSKKLPNKVDNRRTVDHEHFCRLIVEGVSPSEAIVRAGGKEGNSNSNYAQKLKIKYKDKIRQMAIDSASDGMYSMIRLAPKAVQVISDALDNPEISPTAKAKLAKDVLGNIQDLLPKQTVHEHVHTHEISDDKAEQAAKLLLAQFRGVNGGGSPVTVDADFEEQPRTGECDITGSGEEQE